MEKSAPSNLSQAAPMLSVEAALQQMCTLLGAAGFTQDRAAIEPWLTDWRGRYCGEACAMVAPSTTADTAAIVDLARRANLAIVPQGGNSGLVGGATPDASGTQLLLSTRRLNRIRYVAAQGGYMIVEAGVVLADVHQALAGTRWRFPLTLASKGSATIGGLISTNAGGTQVLRHGTMRNLVEAVEAVLADGQIFPCAPASESTDFAPTEQAEQPRAADALTPLKKDNRGYDLRHLLCGAEGTLGIVTAATLRLVPAQRERCVAWLACESPQAALDIFYRFSTALASHIEAFELIEDICLRNVCVHIPQVRPPLSPPDSSKDRHRWHVLIELSSAEAQNQSHSLEDKLLAAAAPCYDSGLIVDMAIAPSESAVDSFWRIRESISEAESRAAPALQHDISVPPHNIPLFLAENPKRLAERFADIRTSAFGHMGDGNIHYHVQAPHNLGNLAHGQGDDSRHSAQQWLSERAADIERIIYAHAIELGGSVSAEHGIGQAKRDLLAEFSSPAHVAALRAVKRGLDPQNLFNPNKLVP